MKTLVRRIPVLLFAGLTFAVCLFAPKKLTPSEAKEHFGETATVCGEVVSTRYAEPSKGQPTFLNLDKPYPNQIFTAVIRGENRIKFGKPESDYKGKQICVSGKITVYAGQPEIVVTDSKQVTVESKK
jgi:hypothetical protein